MAVSRSKPLNTAVAPKRRHTTKRVIVPSESGFTKTTIAAIISPAPSN